jgi:hypothetical protein
MAGEIKRIVDAIIKQRAKGNPTVAICTKTKLMLKGVNPDNFNERTPDDPSILAKVKAMAVEMGVSI